MLMDSAIVESVCTLLYVRYNVAGGNHAEADNLCHWTRVPET
jgi:hypothetical protein